MHRSSRPDGFLDELAAQRLRPNFWHPQVQSFGYLAASAIAGLLWTLASPRVAFAYLVAWMLLALAALWMTIGRRV